MHQIWKFQLDQETNIFTHAPTALLVNLICIDCIKRRQVEFSLIFLVMYGAEERPGNGIIKPQQYMRLV